MFHYCVRCCFEGADSDLPARWLAWLEEEHLAEVLDAGAESADVLRLDGEPTCFAVYYRFGSRADFEAYERDHAPRLREEGLKRFPLSLGLRYSRETGERLLNQNRA